MTDAQQAEHRKLIALALLASTQFVIVLDEAIVNVAIPSIGDDLSSRGRTSHGPLTPTP
jgi:hypothetical protein